MRRRIERGFSMGLWAEIRKLAEIRQPEPRKPDFGHPEEQLSGLHKDLNGAIRRAGPEPCGLEAHVGEGGRCAVRIRRVWGVGCGEPEPGEEAAMPGRGSRESFGPRRDPGWLPEFASASRSGDTPKHPVRTPAPSVEPTYNCAGADFALLQYFDVRKVQQ